MKIRDWDQVPGVIRQRGIDELALRELETAMNRELDAVKARYAREIAAQRDALTHWDAVLRLWAEAHRAEMTPASASGGLVYRCLFGKIAFRKLPPRIRFVKKVEKVMAALKAARLTDCIRTTEEPNKEVLLGLDDATLKAVHVKKVDGERFEVVPDYEEIAKHA